MLDSFEKLKYIFFPFKHSDKNGIAKKKKKKLWLNCNKT